LIAYSVASVLVLLVSGVIPGSMLFLASYRLHAWSYIKNSQLIVAHRLAERYDRLNEAYLLDSGSAENPKKPAASYTNIVSDRDIYVDFLYAMSVNLLNTPGDAAPRDTAAVRRQPVRGRAGGPVRGGAAAHLPAAVVRGGIASARARRSP